ncbi:hypothetical protein AB1Y20_012440 [Prymnesium parvum]|uniref:Phospholipid scramblase n=1 Tax=Prymnesium parvum TaxID=97485 RepID=A0AB34ILE7_PRYPA
MAQMRRLSVVVPPGMKEGQPMDVSTPDGIMEVVIPRGMSEGMRFHFQMPVEPVEPVAAHRSVPQFDYNTMGEWKRYQGGINAWKAGSACGCLNDVRSCCLGCCFPCVLYAENADLLQSGEHAEKFPDAAMFRCPGQFIACLSHLGPFGLGYCLSACLCPEYTCCGCYTTSMVKMTMLKYHLEFPVPCGGAECLLGGSACLCSAFFVPCCMLCLVHRELKLREQKPEQV